MNLVCFFFFQAEDGIRDRSPSRGLGDVYKRQVRTCVGSPEPRVWGVGAIKGRKGWEQVRVVRVSRFGGPEVLSVEKAAGGLPGEGEALVRVEFAGVNFIDVYH